MEDFSFLRDLAILLFSAKAFGIGSKIREVRRKQKISEKVLLRLRPFPSAVERVSDELERIERHADGKHIEHERAGVFGCAEDLVEVIGKMSDQAVVSDGTEDPQIEHHGDDACGISESFVL